MACMSPLFAMPTIYKTESGKRKYQILKNFHYEYFDKNGNEKKVDTLDLYFQEYLKNLPLSEKENLLFDGVRPVPVPCGKCLGCRMDYARRWADRCLLESQFHDKNWFCTFTYDNDHVPVNDRGIQTLRYKDFQDFLKRLRKEGYKFRYYACSEYGDNTFRPHYHCIFFGLDLKESDFVPYKNVGNYVYSSCPTLEKIWSNGFVVVCPLSYETCAYTARYVVKKAGKLVDYESMDIEPEKTYMSRRPGIGYQFYQNHDVFEYDYISVGNENGAKRIYPSRYFEKLLEKDDPERLKQIKEKRYNNMLNQVKMKLDKTDLSYLELLSTEEENFCARISSLRRDRIDY